MAEPEVEQKTLNILWKIRPEQNIHKEDPKQNSEKEKRRFTGGLHSGCVGGRGVLLDTNANTCEQRAASCQQNLPAEGCECIPRHPTTLLAVLAPGSARITTESTSRR